MFGFFTKIFQNKSEKFTDLSDDMKYLIVGLGNIGEEYKNTRHNIGFDVVDKLAELEGIKFEADRYGAIASFRHKSRGYILLKPSTYMNLSGKAVSYWMKNEKIPLENILIVVDDLAIPFGKLRLKTKGGDAGHNGLKSIQEMLGTTNYARLRFGLGDNFRRGQQVNFVLSKWDTNEENELEPIKEEACEIIKSFGVLGAERTMNFYNKK